MDEDLEDRIDAQIARDRLAEIDADPSLLVGGEQLEAELREILGN